jgi:hypothetical protein
VIVRAIDKAGNMRDVSIDVKKPLIVAEFIKDNLVLILLGIILVGLSILILHYLVGHHIVRKLRSAFKSSDEPTAVVRAVPPPAPPTPLPPKPPEMFPPQPPFPRV